MISYNFAGQCVLITGSGRGVGRATAMAFAQAGAKVAIHYNSHAEEAEQLLEALPGSGHISLQANIGDFNAARQLVLEAIEHFGRLDVLVNNAGIFEPHAVAELDFEDWMASFNKTIAVNLQGAAACAYTAARQMILQKEGTIINVGSRGAFRGEGGQPGYGAAKAGLHALSQSLAQSLGQFGITVHAIAPGFIETAMVRPHLQGAAGDAVRAQSPLNRVATVEEVAKAILFLASNDAEWTTGAVLDFNGASYLH